MDKINPWIIGGVLVVVALLALSRGGSSGAGGSGLASQQIASAQDTALGSASIGATVAREQSARDLESHKLDVLSQVVQARLHDESARHQSMLDFFSNVEANATQRQQAQLVFTNQVINGTAMYRALARSADLQTQSQVQLAQIAAGAQNKQTNASTTNSLINAGTGIIGSILKLFL